MMQPSERTEIFFGYIEVLETFGIARNHLGFGKLRYACQEQYATK
jgi:hypothetical protein